MNKLSIQQELEVIEKRKKGIYIKDIMIEYGIKSKKAFYNLLKRNGREKIKPNKKYSVNEDFFETINTEEKAYWLGFIFADGYVRRRNSCSLEIKLSSKDRIHLVNFLSDISSNYNIKDKESIKIYKGEEKLYKSSGVYIYSEKIYEDLVNKGCFNCKSLILEPPKNINKEFIPHFIRGYFDGDGCITNYLQRNKINTKIKILGTLNFLNWINISLFENNISFRKVDKQTDKIFRIQYNTKDVIGIYNYFYKDSHRFLERKKEKFLNI